jgi:OmpA-OmpF porin, OOP family
MKFKSFHLLCATMLLASSLQAQIDVGQKIIDKSTSRADEKTDQGIDKGLDAAEDGIKSLFTKKDKSKAEGKKNSTEETKSTSTEAKQQKEPEIALTSATKYDFVPGDKILLYEDFMQDAVGDFPALWTTNGSGEVRTLNKYPGNWLFMNTADKAYCLMKDLALPDNFIFEFDVVPTSAPDNENISSFWISMYESSGEFMTDELYPGLGGFNITCKNDAWEVRGYKDGAQEVTDGNSELAPIEIGKLNHVIVWVQKRRLRIYHKGQKVIDLPTILYDGFKYNRFRVSLWGTQGFPYLSNLRFTTAKPDMRSKLLTEGKLVSYGIYFDINSDQVKAESNGTLKEIAKVLTENPAVRIKIVGHTDGDGDAAKNLDLSKRRAASVKTELSKSYGVDANQIETDGKGKTEPLVPNTSASNKAQNRRVEFIKL